MSKEEFVVNAVTSTVSPVNYSTGIFLYERLVENIHKGPLFVNEAMKTFITYETFLQYSCRLADSLTKYGLDSKNVVSMCCENCIEYFIPVMAGLFSGIPTTFTNPNYTKRELIHALTLTTPPIVFCTIRTVKKMIDIKKICPEIKDVVVINSDTLINGAWNLQEFIDKYSVHVDVYNYKPVAVDVENHIAHILFSSGTTGLPKGVMLTHKNFNCEITACRTGVKNVCQAYGMTETTIFATIVPIGIDQPKSCGKLLPNVTGIVRNLKTGQNLGPHQNGELCLKGGTIMKGYYKNEIATKNAFTEDGYLRTGDIGHYDEKGFFYIQDRLKELIKYKGYQVAPAELENVLLTNPKIRKAAVIGISDENAGELPMAFVVKQPDVNLSEQEVTDYVKGLVAPVKYLRGGVVFVEDIPISPTGKILRKELRQLIKVTSKL